MADQVFPTKGNLIAAKRSLALSKLGYDLMDRKRNVLVRELMQLVDRAKELRGSIEKTYELAYARLQEANITLGVADRFANAVPVDQSVAIATRTVMGVEIPIITHEDEMPSDIPYGFLDTNVQLDEAYAAFIKVRNMTLMLAEVDTGVFRLATAISATQRRANALKEVLIPRYTQIIRTISDALEDKEREEFTRMKIIKATKN
ncbi:MAG: V-type ATP synthase subunit D [Oscillospiraceae bacterium]|nr:V-type ATP synthase subunit D [Oscillospiraceae bacterium]